MQGLWIFAAVIVVVGLFVWLATVRNTRQVSAWLVFARRRGLTLTPSTSAWSSYGTRITGTVQGVTVTIETFGESSGGRGGQATFTRVRGVACRSIDVSARVYREHLFSGVGAVLGFQDVKTGDATFDDALVVKADAEDEVRTLLTASVRRALVDAPHPSHFRYDRGSMELRWAGAETSLAVLDRALDAVLAAGGAGGGPTSETARPRSTDG